MAINMQETVGLLQRELPEADVERDTYSGVSFINIRVSGRTFSVEWPKMSQDGKFFEIHDNPDKDEKATQIHATTPTELTQKIIAQVTTHSPSTAGRSYKPSIQLVSDAKAKKGQKQISIRDGYIYSIVSGEKVGQIVKQTPRIVQNTAKRNHTPLINTSGVPKKR